MGAMITNPSGPCESEEQVVNLPAEIREPAPEPPLPLERQVGGNHYQKHAIQPIEYILANGLDFCQGNVVKLVTRFREKGGIEDLDKAIHYIEFMKAQARGEDASIW